MTGYIKYFEYGGMSMSFLIKNGEVWEKYIQIWGLIKNKLGIKFHSSPAHDKRYLKTKVKEYDGVIKFFQIMMCQKKINIILVLLALLLILL